MSQPPLTKTVGVSCGLAGFAVATFSGLAADNPAPDVLLRALISMFVCYLIGLAIGFAFDVVAQERDAANRRDNPVPDMNASVESNVQDAAAQRRADSTPVASAA